jgi:hypothetical protein
MTIRTDESAFFCCHVDLPRYHYPEHICLDGSWNSPVQLAGDSNEIRAKRVQITNPKRDRYGRAIIKSSSPQTHSFSTQKPPCLWVFRYLLFLEALAYFNCTLTAEKYVCYVFERHAAVLSLSESKEIETRIQPWTFGKSRKTSQIFATLNILLVLWAENNGV